MEKTDFNKLVVILIVCSICVQGQQDGSSGCPVSPDEDFKENKPLEAVIGGNVILTCFPKFNIPFNDYVLELSKGNDEIFVTNGNYIKHVDKDYQGRLQCSIEELKKGNASLYLSNVKQSDEGSYCCCIRRIGKPVECINVTLAVKTEEEQTSTERPGNQQIDTPEAPTNSTGSNTEDWKTGVGVGVGVGVLLVLLIAVAAGLHCACSKGKQSAGLGYVCWKRKQSADGDENPNNPEESVRIELEPADNREQV